MGGIVSRKKKPPETVSERRRAHPDITPTPSLTNAEMEVDRLQTEHTKRLRKQKGRFDASKSTEHHYGFRESKGLLEAFADERKNLDYSYHCYYSQERQVLHNAIVTMTLENYHVQQKPLLPWVVFTAGAMGAGKGHVANWMNKLGYFPTDMFVVADPDAIRKELPEWSLYVKEDAELAGQRTQKEAGQIAEITILRSLKLRRNLLIDGSLRDTKWYQAYFSLLRRNFPGIRIGILHIVATPEAVYRRAAMRALKTGRGIPRSVLDAAIKAVPESVKVLAPLSDFCCRLDNSSDTEPPKLQREPTATRPGPDVPLTWEFVSCLWHAKSIDTDGNGTLSKQERNAAMKRGLVGDQTLSSLDLNKDGRIDQDEVAAAENKAARASMVEDL